MSGLNKTIEKIYWSSSTKNQKKRFQKLIDKAKDEQKDCQSEWNDGIQKHFDELSGRNYPLSYSQ